MKIIFCLLISLTGFTAAEESCSRHVSFVCAPRESQPSFPKTAEDLKKACDILTESFQCGADYEKRCNPDSRFIAKATNVLSALNEMCTEDTLLHGAVVDNLGCFEQILLGPNECNGNLPDEETLKMQAEELLKEGLDALDEESKEDRYSCLRAVNLLACQALLTSNNCGMVAMSAYVRFARKISIPVVFDCGEKFAEMLPAVIRLRQVANEVEEALEERKK